ncbi:MAG TPA: 4Fe-4S binding protein [Candidatus Omnitrophota bacterium]|nr:MAG: Ferredoxin [Candidatus Omnitrophica bacterium ADurb.Bin314]HOE69330.1 4Fe-4S binding protein [Candidatus Omnitrophota bacterium]HQB93929.1 4Fe-4S binding protein [Candidatus Omnitrophota bacterium]
MVKIDVNLCTGCGDCASNCPVEAIKVVNNKATVNDQCIDCGACVAGCQPQAISQ